MGLSTPDLCSKPSLPFSPGSRDGLGLSGQQVERQRLLKRFSKRLIVNDDLSRQMVSFQANRLVPGLRWLKYREGFSSSLIHYLATHAEWQSGTAILDPFSGSGTTILTASMFATTCGIELLPVGHMTTRAIISASRMTQLAVDNLRKFALNSIKSRRKHDPIPELRITAGAYSELTRAHLSNLRHATIRLPPAERELLTVLVLSVLEEVSFTRKDGQYLRWDGRSGRPTAKLEKGPLPTLSEALEKRFMLLEEDLPQLHHLCIPENIRLFEGSCLERLPLLPSGFFDGVVTSPPYANRYDYTRTYALELAYLGCGEDEVKHFRQELLSATVENKSKSSSLRETYTREGMENAFISAELAVKNSGALNEALRAIRAAEHRGDLPNRNVLSLLENYFLEMTLVISQLARCLKPGGTVYMVNDNVQYSGEEVPVDLILSDIAENFGLSVESIWQLPRGKGNASQQMGKYGRKEIRKCVYVWRKQLNLPTPKSSSKSSISCAV